jgi:hypothetical protein
VQIRGIPTSGGELYIDSLAADSERQLGGLCRLILPTLIELCGLQALQDARFDGVSPGPISLSIWEKVEG